MGTAGCRAFVLAGTGAAEAAEGTVREARTLSGIERVVLRGAGDLLIRQAQQREGLIVEAESRLLPRISAVVKAGTLYLDIAGSVSTQFPLRYELTVNNLRDVRAEGSGQVTLNALHVPTLDLTLAGSGDAQVSALKADRLTLAIAGSGSLTAAGDAAEQSIVISGAGEFHGEALRGRSATVRITGSGNAAVQVRDTLHVDIEGSGNVTYEGSPRIAQRISGAGEVRRR